MTVNFPSYMYVHNILGKWLVGEMGWGVWNDQQQIGYKCQKIQ